MPTPVAARPRKEAVVVGPGGRDGQLVSAASDALIECRLVRRFGAFGRTACGTPSGCHIDVVAAADRWPAAWIGMLNGRAAVLPGDLSFIGG